MTAGVDVLAVMDARLRELNKFSAHTNDEAEEIELLTEARAAVAELIERERVMREALGDLRAQCVRNLELGATGPGYWTDAQETIDAALARVQGGAA